MGLVFSQTIEVDEVRRTKKDGLFILACKIPELYKGNSVNLSKSNCNAFADQAVLKGAQWLKPGAKALIDFEVGVQPPNNGYPAKISLNVLKIHGQG